MHNFFVLATGVLLYQAINICTNEPIHPPEQFDHLEPLPITKSRLANARSIHQGRHALQVLRSTKAGCWHPTWSLNHSFALENGPFIDDKNDAIYIEKEIHTMLYKKTIGH